MLASTERTADIGLGQCGLISNYSFSINLDLAGVLSYTNCRQSKSLNKKANERNVIHMAITEIGCSRFKGPTSISVPLVNNSNSIIQTVKDLRDMHTLSWQTAIILYDDSVSEDVFNMLKNIMSENAAVSAFELGSDPSQSISSILAGLPVRELGYKFLVIAREASINGIHERAESSGLMNIKTQWLYLVTDSDATSTMMPKPILEAKDGYNLAFLYNASKPNGLECKVNLQ